MTQSPPPGIFTSFFRWLRMKNYQYEVTFALYMLTPIEKVIFNTLLLLIISMLLTAAYVYLPNHVVTVCHHVYYYWAGHHFTDPSQFSIANLSVPGPGAVAAESKNIVSIAGEKGYNVIVETAKKAAQNAATTGRAFEEL